MVRRNLSARRTTEADSRQRTATGINQRVHEHARVQYRGNGMLGLTSFCKAPPGATGVAAQLASAARRFDRAVAYPSIDGYSLGGGPAQMGRTILQEPNQVRRDVQVGGFCG